MGVPNVLGESSEPPTTHRMSPFWTVTETVFGVVVVVKLDVLPAETRVGGVATRHPRVRVADGTM
ncbi:MAG TPA: hypothetical protein VHA75_11515 [Rugosimonospora sp.]|nr:hypothetical protein [Rugosimonospora sp.]